MRKNEKYIEINHIQIKELATKEKVSVQTVCAALRFATNSSLAVKLRAMALQPERGGMLHVKENGQM